MSITLTKQTIIIHDFNFDEKTLVQLNKFNEKRTKLHYFFKNRYQIQTIKSEGKT